MLSVNNVVESGKALSYYQLDNYYTNEQQSLDQTEWYGRGAQVLGINGEQIEANIFKDLLEGRVEDQQLGRVRKDENGQSYIDHRAGIDLTFSAPKSVSIMAEVFENQDVLQAHLDAVKDTISAIEDHYTQTRISVDGTIQKSESDNLVVALFNHNTSRALDPQTHTHAVVMNMTLNDKDSWTALSNEVIYDNQATIGSIYNSNLAQNLRAIGLDVEVKDNQGNFEIAGFTPEMIQEFSQRRTQIIESLKSRGIDIEDAPASLREQAALKTRERKQAFNEAELRQVWKERASELGITQSFVDKLEDKIKTNQMNADPQPSEKNQKDIWKTGSSKNDPNISFEGKTEVSSDKSNNADKEAPDKRIDNSETQNPSDSAISNEKASQGSGKSQKEPETQNMGQEAHIQDEGRLGKKQTEPKASNNSKDQTVPRERPYQRKNRESQQVLISQKTKEAVYYAIGHHTEREMMIPETKILNTAMKFDIQEVTHEQVRAELNRLEKEKIIVRVDGKLTTQRLAHSEVWSLQHIQNEQKSVSPIVDESQVKTRLDQEEQLRGRKFTPGQRASLETIFSSESRYIGVDGLAGTGKTTMLHTLNKVASENGFIVKGMAATGVAAKNLELETGIPSKTMAMFQIKENELQKEIEKNGGVNRKNEIWIVDESSFVSQTNFKDILTLAKQANSRVVFLGDKLQLQSISAGKPFELVQNRGVLKTSQMHDIIRQKNQELKDVVSVVVAKNKEGKIDLSNNDKAFDLLDKQQRIHEVVVAAKGTQPALHEQHDLFQEIHEVHQKLVGDYMRLNKESRDNSLIITPFNSDRVMLNSLVRSEMKKLNELDHNDHNFEILVNTNFTEAERKHINNYEPNMTIRFGKSFTDKDTGIKIEKGDYLKVMMKDKEGKLVLIDKDKNKIKWNPKKGSVEVYKSEQRKIAKGDVIRITRTKDDEQIKNGERYKIKDIHEDKVIVEGQDGKEKSLSRSGFKHFDYGYSSTVYSSQGLTQGNVFLLLNSQKLANDLKSDKAATKVLGNTFGTRSFYVAVTREEHNLQIYTDNKQMTREAITFKQDKTSYLDTVKEVGQKVPEHIIENEKIGVTNELER
ncbi:MobF family relaxase [Acinetobacter baumannii]|uniref:MobF family relaxase n=1 Tax=Acinetobacter baumannii TaxID=470 RepID=UPI001D550A53|nr:MobF family relaxase [Acinetobacter baumannii]EKT7984133.1 conjugative relaxase [Acinetobacter baumannii]EKT8018702.1 conjugative relaxase [Acinetobacter baumannii]EKT8372434.1 conjugative relaxase [Acinetobacter baumannii]EKT8396734.1 conjugative relaxase [Acinetobacter baumannii]EKT8400861.1 conjugative relaxase [Acinetobacter baumannii]